MNLTLSDNNKSKFLVQKMLSKAGITINGSNPWDVQVYSSDIYNRILAQGNMGLGESYMEGLWDCERLDLFFEKILRADLDQGIKSLTLAFYHLKARFLNLQTKKRAWQVGEKHYDLNNDFYRAMLGKSMAYSCAYWHNAKNLDEAQEAKYDLICRKLQLQPGMTLLDIGCGWGGLMNYARQHYQIKGIGLTISKEQLKWAKEHYSHPDLEFRLQDYRDLLIDNNYTMAKWDHKVLSCDRNAPLYDRIVSVGMFEHVGAKNYRTYMKIVEKCLKNEGIFLLHTIGKNSRHATTDPWINHYIFPNGDLPSLNQIADAASELLLIEDFHSLGAYYDRTLMAWYNNFEQSWRKFQDQLGEVFYRMWRYYLLCCAGSFRARNVQLWQLVFSKQGLSGIYPRYV